MPRRLVAFAAVLGIAGFLHWQIGWIIPPLIFWAAAAGVALFLALAVGPPKDAPTAGDLPAGPFLCDRCRYSYGDACTRPERPNAERCPDYRRR